jgi:hypothetical protein
MDSMLVVLLTYEVEESLVADKEVQDNNDFRMLHPVVRPKIAVAASSRAPHGVETLAWLLQLLCNRPFVSGFGDCPG